MIVPNTASATMPMPTSCSAESPPLVLEGRVTGAAVVKDDVVVVVVATLPDAVVVVATPPSPLASAPAGNASAAHATAAAVAARMTGFRRFIAPNISAAGP